MDVQYRIYGKFVVRWIAIPPNDDFSGVEVRRKPRTRSLRKLNLKSQSRSVLANDRLYWSRYEFSRSWSVRDKRSRDSLDKRSHSTAPLPECVCSQRIRNI